MKKALDYSKTIRDRNGYSDAIFQLHSLRRGPSGADVSLLGIYRREKGGGVAHGARTHTHTHRVLEKKALYHNVPPMRVMEHGDLDQGGSLNCVPSLRVTAAFHSILPLMERSREWDQRWEEAACSAPGPLTRKTQSRWRAFVRAPSFQNAGKPSLSSSLSLALSLSSPSCVLSTSHALPFFFFLLSDQCKGMHWADGGITES
ncbi:uncharacterized protein LOC124385192 [Silurus meridionalis]|uniref:uncharacterized protein LOC124385192 n=1 Tax=Silurus meridionalis TaxID=175797 RepID=UPI001EE9B8CB|nr:uncharacterized protein LOC124385192 [Silurus meridionalis]